MAIFKGAGVAIVTPMHADGSVNFEKLEETIDYQIENGTVLLSAVQPVSLPHCQRTNILNVSVQLSAVQQAEFLLLQVQVPTVQRQPSI